MDHEGCSSGGASAPVTFTFAFNDSNFSDRVLQIDILAVPEKFDAESSCARQKKRRRADHNTEAGMLLLPFPSHQIYTTQVKSSDAQDVPVYLLSKRLKATVSLLRVVVDIWIKS
jgi:hypothetical protein